ncbi:hypothetical protein Tco_0434696 [Tanacetum coccineum]
MLDYELGLARAGIHTSQAGGSSNYGVPCKDELKDKHFGVVSNKEEEEEKRKQAAEGISSLRKSLKIRIKQQKPTSTTPLPLSDDQERDDIIKATQLSLTLDKTAKAYEEQKNVVVVEEKMLEEDLEKLVDGNKESVGTEFANTILLSDEDSGNRLEPGNYKENPKKNDDDDEKKDNKKDDDDDNDDDDHDDNALIKTQVTDSSEIRTEKMQTPIPLPLRSPRTDLSSNEAIDKELTVSVTPTPATSSQDQSKPISRRRTNLLGSVAKMSRGCGQLRQHMNNTFNTVLNVHPITSTSTATISDLQQQLYLKMKSNLQAQVVKPEWWDVLKLRDDAPYEGEKSVKRQKTSKSSKYARGSLSKQSVKETNTFASERKQQQDWDATPKLIDEFQNADKRVPIVFDRKRMEINHRKVRDDPEEFFSDHKIVEVVRVTTEQQYGLDFMQQIIMMRGNNMPYSFSKADFKYLNKNDIEDMYYLCLNKKVNYRLINLNIKNEKRFMDLEYLSKFCDPTLENVLNEVKLKIFETEFMKKAPDACR